MKTDAKNTRNRTAAVDAGDTRMAGLARLDDMDDYKVADGEPDPRGWDVKARDGRRIGKVKSLLADREAMRVRFLEVELDDRVANGREDRCVHVPVRSARLDDDHDDVHVDLDAAAIGLLGTATMDDWHATDADADADRGFFGKRRGKRDDAAYLVRHEEQVAVGTRATQAGAVNVRKTVESERVSETVPVRHEEVTVDRRPISAGTRADGNTRIEEGELRVPVMAEEVVTEKRVVPVEEVVIRKATVTDQQQVDATVRKERIEVDRQAGKDREPRAER